MDLNSLLARETRTASDLENLISPEAGSRLEALAKASADLTRRRFGRTISLYAPLYLSNYCVNPCAYCGFSVRQKIARATLTPAEISSEARSLRARGFSHVLLLTGEDRRQASVAYLEAAVGLCREHFAHVSIEVYPMTRAEYARLVAAGASAVTLYQETYDRELYARVHPGGPKADYDARYDAPIKAAAAGMRGVGLGFLLGLAPWREEIRALYRQAVEVQKASWQTRLAFSFPRLRPAAGGYEPGHPVSDAELAQMIFSLRLMFPDAELVLSTRESSRLRDGFLGLGVTRMSAGSVTTPGGYHEKSAAGEQFAIHDARGPAEMAAAITARGLDPVWKDWSEAMTEVP
ncbi:2-iminoacetate synthase ThiH [Myxococcota bacterium]|nr:2-iminoacetate synthase ThiH [Myxococcota bacterium]MBU1411596.1 2-iminoacetate synthase ThiH [Myxococcota bacterium]MBU1509080.1 2-iminoacetate synthase ThiH [Myxococcota bacterium]